MINKKKIGHSTIFKNKLNQQKTPSSKRPAHTPTMISSTPVRQAQATVEPFPDIYLYQMPYRERDNLCRILTNQNICEALALQMGYELSDVKSIKESANKSNNSEAEELLTWWGDLNHTIHELFYLFIKMKNYEAMAAIRKIIDPKHHWLINVIPGMYI